jgi:hypothetical protein
MLSSLTNSETETWQGLIARLANLPPVDDVPKDILAEILDAHDRLWTAPPIGRRAYVVSKDDSAVRTFPSEMTTREVRKTHPDARPLPRGWRPETSIEEARRLNREGENPPIDIDAMTRERVREMHRLVQTSVVAWLRTGSATLPAVALVGSEGEGVHRRPVVSVGMPPLMLAIQRAFTGDRFPFALCPTCDTVFLRVKRQVYCSPVCADRGNSEERRAKRREYMRVYMERRRRQARRAAPSRKED